MKLWGQLAAGAVILGICVAIHVIVLGAGVGLVKSTGSLTNNGDSALHTILLLMTATFVALVGHTIQVWLWAAIFRYSGALHQLDEAVYFALVTSTTLGYGDITLSDRFRVLGSMAAVNGLMTYGLSTAFLVGTATAAFSIRA